MLKRIDKSHFPFCLESFISRNAWDKLGYGLVVEGVYYRRIKARRVVVKSPVSATQASFLPLIDR